MTTVAAARGAQRTAQEIEATGWDGMLVVDSQNLSGDPYVSLALAAVVTRRIGLGTGVTNSVTPHAAPAPGAPTRVPGLAPGPGPASPPVTRVPTAGPGWGLARGASALPISAA